MLLALVARGAADVDPVGGRKIVELESGRVHIVTTVGRDGPQLEIAVGERGYTICPLVKGGVPPFTLIKSAEGLKTTFTTLEDKNEIVVIDSDGDGLPEMRMTLVRDQSGKTTRVIKEKITYSFSESVTPAGPADTITPVAIDVAPTALPERETPGFAHEADNARDYKLILREPR
ncbi:MAG TPA: hypothetical protein VGD81_08335 [Opitutaceae bacterium]